MLSDECAASVVVVLRNYTVTQWSRPQRKDNVSFFANPDIKNTELLPDTCLPSDHYWIYGYLRSSSSVIIVIFTSTLKVKTESYSETFVSVYQTTRRHILPEHSLHSWSVLFVCFSFSVFTACNERLYLCSMSNRTLVRLSQQTILIHLSCSTDRWFSKCGPRARWGFARLFFDFVIEIRRQKYCIHSS
jgi:hypothetical protein